MSETEDDDEVLTVACVQFDVHRGDVQGNLQRARAGLDKAAAEGARLCVLPELWSTSFVATFEPGLVDAARAAEAHLLELSRRHDQVIVASAIEATANGVYNTARVYDCGNELGAYRKIHLFSPIGENRLHQAGDLPLCVDTSVGRLGVIICYDLRFPELARWYFHQGAEILAVPAQWPEARSVHWRTLVRARAIENQMFVVGCNRTGQETSLKGEDMLAFPGDSRIVDPMGEVLAAGSGAEEPVIAEIELRRSKLIRRILPICRDQRPAVYERLWEQIRDEAMKSSRQDCDQD